MSANDINELRKHLFAALDGLSNKETPLDIDRAKAIADVSQTVINSVKAETEYLKATGQVNGSGFIRPVDANDIAAGPVIANPPPLPSLSDQLAGANVRTHRMK